MSEVTVEDINGWNILHDAVLRGHADMVQHIVKLQPGESIPVFVIAYINQAHRMSKFCGMVTLVRYNITKS